VFESAGGAVQKFFLIEYNSEALLADSMPTVKVPGSFFF